MLLHLVLVLLVCALPRSRQEDINFPEICPSDEDATWCTAANREGRECNYRRPDGSVVFKLLDNVWYNCPRHCFDCKFPGRQINLTLADLVQTSEDFKLPPPGLDPSSEVVELWLEQRTIGEAFERGPCEDAAAYGESGEPDICKSWIEGYGPSYCRTERLDKFDPSNPSENFSRVKGNGWWWCKRSCRFC